MRLITIYFITVLALAISALLIGYVVQEFLSHAPCELCIYQRYVYFALAANALLYLLHKNNNRKCLISLLISIFITMIGIGVSGFHSAVERKWIDYKSQCTGHIVIPGSLEEMILAIDRAPVAFCNIMGPKVLGLTMANWGAILFLSIFISSLIVFNKSKVQ